MRKLGRLAEFGNALLAAILLAVAAVPAAAGTLTAASGGSAITPDTAGSTFTTLTGPVLTETATGNVGTGTIVLSAPAGFEFDTTASVTVLITRVGGSGANGNNINGVPSSTPVAATVTSTTIAFTVTRSSRNGVTNSLTWQNVRVRPQLGVAPPPSGNLTNTGTAATAGVGAGANWGTLTVTTGVSCTTPTWMNNAWLHREPLVIQSSQVAGTLTNFPVLIFHTDANLAAAAQASGNDIVFTAADGVTKLAHEIERYTSATGEIIAWVRVPSASNTANTTIYMYYGNAAAPNEQLLQQVWDANFSAVWHLKEQGNGTANEYADSTANANSAQGGAGDPTMVPTQVAGKIGYGENFNGNNIIALLGTAANMPDVSGAQTMSFWFNVAANSAARSNFLVLRTNGGGAANQADFVAGIQGPTQCTAGSTNPIGLTQWGGVCTIQTPAPAAGQWHYFTWTLSGSTNILYMDGVQVQTNTQGVQTGPVADILFGSYNTTASEPLVGNMDETRVSTTARSAQWIQTEYNNQSSPATFYSVGAEQSQSCIAHYAIAYPNGATGITCAASQVRFTAHDASHNPVTVPAGTTLTITTSTGTGVWQTGLVAGTGTWTPSGANNGKATYVWPGGQSSFTAQLRQSQVVTMTINAVDGAGLSVNATEDPSIAFANSLFRFVDSPSGTAPYAGNPINAQISGKPSNVGYNAQPGLVLQAIQTDNSGACTGIFNGTVQIQLASECVNPTACRAGEQVAFTNNGVTINLPQNGAGGVSGTTGSYTSANVLFGANSQASFSFSYPDAGNIRLHARYVLTPPAAGLTYTYGASGNITVRPFGFRISGPPSGVSGPTSTVFTAAGQNFNTTLTAVAWKSGDDANADGIPDSQAQIAANVATPNFGLETTPATAAMSQTLAEPVGGATGALTGATTFSGFSAGTQTQAIAYSEVGIINLLASTTNYLGSGENITAGVAGLTGVGRFIPSYFTLSGGALTNRSASSCSPASAFTYMGEGLQLQFTLTAQNTAGATTTNYRGSYARLALTPAGLAFGARDTGGAGTNLTSRLDTSAGVTGSWGNGVAGNVAATVAIARAAPNPDGPFNQVGLGIAPVDPDGVALQASALNLNVSGGGNDHQRIGATTQILFGRLRLQNALGSELLPLPIPMYVDNWNGTGFVVNSNDSCTTLPQSSIVMSNYLLNLNPPCRTAFSAASITFANGTATPTLAAPGAANNGSVDLRVELGATAGQYCPSSPGAQAATSSAGRSYLQGSWTGATYNQDPTARAAFGVYGTDKTTNQLIYFRENY